MSTAVAQSEESEAPRARPQGARRAPLYLWLALVFLTGIPYLAAERWPPPGHRFSGIFFYQDDFYQYASFAEQAMRSAFRFHNKFDPRPHDPVIVNLEWWLAGVAGGLLGGPIAGFHALRPLALLVLVTACARMLALAGLGGSRQVWGLLLVLTAGGLGWLRLWQGTPGSHIPDLLMSLYPAHQALLNTHTALGTGLALWTLALHLEWRAGRRARWPWIAAAWVMALVRPYDLLTFTVVAGALALTDLADRGRRALAWQRLADLAWLVPLFLYYAWLIAPGSAQSGWDGRDAGDVNPPVLEFAFAFLLPALLCALLLRRGEATAGVESETRRALGLWALVLVALVLLYHAPLMKTFVTSLAVALLLLAAAATPRRWLPWAVLALAPTSLFLLWRAFHPWPHWFLPRDYFAAAEDLRQACAPRQVVLAPTDLSLLVAAVTSCHVVAGHRSSTPSFSVRVREGNQFYYGTDTTPEWRLRYLRAMGADFVLMPAGRGAMLGPDPPWVRRLSLPLLEVWQRRAR